MNDILIIYNNEILNNNSTLNIEEQAKLQIYSTVYGADLNYYFNDNLLNVSSFNIDNIKTIIIDDISYTTYNNVEVIISDDNIKTLIAFLSKDDSKISDIYKININLKYNFNIDVTLFDIYNNKIISKDEWYNIDKLTKVNATIKYYADNTDSTVADIKYTVIKDIAAAAFPSNASHNEYFNKFADYRHIEHIEPDATISYNFLYDDSEMAGVTNCFTVYGADENKIQITSTYKVAPITNQWLCHT
jgi:hypothetical protein